MARNARRTLQQSVAPVLAGTITAAGELTPAGVWAEGVLSNADRSISRTMAGAVWQEVWRRKRSFLRRSVSETGDANIQQSVRTAYMGQLGCVMTGLEPTTMACATGRHLARTRNGWLRLTKKQTWSHRQHCRQDCVKVVPLPDGADVKSVPDTLCIDVAFKLLNC